MPRKHESLADVIERVESQIELAKAKRTAFPARFAYVRIDDVERLIVAVVDGDDVA